MVDLTLPGQSPLAFFADNLAPLGSFSFVFDDIGFGPVAGSLRIDDDLIGLGIPAIDLGLNLDYTIGARLVFEAGFDGGTTDVGYTLTEGSFVNQTSLSSFNSQIQADLSASGRALYRNAAITFSLDGVDALAGGGSLVATGGDPGKTYVSARFDYTVGLTVRDPFIGIPFKDFDLGGSTTLIPTATRSIEIIPKTVAGSPIWSQDTGVFAGSFIQVPTLPDYVPSPAVTIDGEAALPTLSIEDTGAPFAQIKLNIAKAITENLGIPLAPGFSAGGLTAELEVLRAIATANLSVGQKQSFIAEAVHVRLELFDESGVSTGRVLQGALGDELSFDSLGVGKGFIRADYTLYGALETETGLVAAAALELGLLAGRIAWDGPGPDFDIGFGPLIPLPSPSFTSGLLPLFGDREAVIFDPITRWYPIYSEKDAVGTNADDLIQVGPSQTADVRGFGGNDTIDAYDINADRLIGGTGNDIIRGAIRKFDFDSGTPPTTVPRSDTILGETGNDALFGGEAGDLIDGGSGSDFITGVGGDDTLSSSGTDGTDTVSGGFGVDLLSIHRAGILTPWVLDITSLENSNGGVASAVLADGTSLKSIERWMIATGFGADSLRGGSRDDTLNGGAGADSLNGGGGADFVSGGAGDDMLFWLRGGTQPAPDELAGAGGFDLVHLETSGSGGVFQFNLTGNAGLGPGKRVLDIIDVGNDPYYAPLLQDGVEVARAFISAGDADYLGYGAVERLRYSNSSLTSRSSITGGAYQDTITTGGGADRLDGWLGRDILDGGIGADTVISWDADATLSGGSGIDELRLFRGSETKAIVLDMMAVAGGADVVLPDGTVIRTFEKLRIESGKGNDNLRGGVLNDSLAGNAGADLLNGGGGFDRVDAGDGNDTVIRSDVPGGGATIYGDGGTDLLRLDWTAYVGPTRQDLSISLATPGTATTGLLHGGFEILDLTSGDGNDTIIGGNGTMPVIQQVLITSPGGIPSLVPIQTGSVGDRIDGGAGNDSIIGAGGRDIVSAGKGNDTVKVRLGDGDQADGGEGYDVLLVDLGFTGDAGAVQFGEGTQEGVAPDGSTITLETIVLADGTVASNFEEVRVTGIGVGRSFDLSLTRLSDRVVMSEIADRVAGGAGDDLIDGRAGLDTLEGGIGNDTITLIPVDPIRGPGDILAQLLGGAGSDLLRTTLNARISGGDGFDTAEIDFRSDTAGLVANLLNAASRSVSNGTEILGVEHLTLRLGSGGDLARIGLGQAVVEFGAGLDTAEVLRGASSVAQVFSLVTPLAAARGAAPSLKSADGLLLSGFEVLRIETGGGNDRIDLGTTLATNDVIKTGAGNDTLIGGRGNDTLVGGLGNDEADYGAATGGVRGTLADRGRAAFVDGIPDGGDIRSLYATDQLEGIENVSGGSGNDSLGGNAGGNRLSGRGGADTLSGAAGNDTLLGDAGDDLLVMTGGGRDIATGGAGADRFVVGLPGPDLYATIRDFGAEDTLDLRRLLLEIGSTSRDPFGDRLLSWRQGRDGAVLEDESGILLVVTGRTPAELLGAANVLIA